MSVYVCVCFVCLCMSVCAFVCLFMSVWASMYVFTCASLYTSKSVSRMTLRNFELATRTSHLTYDDYSSLLFDYLL